MARKLDFIFDSEVFIDLYNVLDIDIEAKNEEIKNAYIKLVKINHPDHGGNSELYQQITKAYEILYNKETRKEYDLYYLKKSMDEFKGDDILRLKNDYKNFVDSNVKPVSEERLNELYTDIFKDKDKYKEKRIEKEELSRRINDIDLERQNENIESNDEKILKILNELNSKLETPISISEFFEYLKNNSSKTSEKLENSQQSSEIILKDLGTLDTIPGHGSFYSSYITDNEYHSSSLYSDISNENIFTTDSATISEVTSEDFINWRNIKNTKKNDSKLSQIELDGYLEKRKKEENEILNEVELNLTLNTKKKEIEKFIGNNYLNEDIDSSLESNLNTKNKTTNVRKRELK
jgi:curved DNA-binding protein CbpA